MIAYRPPLGPLPSALPVNLQVVPEAAQHHLKMCALPLQFGDLLA